MAKKCWEDFNVGDKVVTLGITVTDAHLVNWAGLTMDFYPLHMDEEFGKKTEFGTRVAHGPLTFAMAIGMVGMTGIFEDSIVAWLGVENMRLPRPVRIGDTIKVEAEVIEKRETKGPRHGIVIFRYRVNNQQDENVMAFDYVLMMHSRAG